MFHKIFYGSVLHVCLHTSADTSQKVEGSAKAGGCEREVTT